MSSSNSPNSRPAEGEEPSTRRGEAGRRRRSYRLELVGELGDRWIDALWQEVSRFVDSELESGRWVAVDTRGCMEIRPGASEDQCPDVELGTFLRRAALQLHIEEECSPTDLRSKGGGRR